MKRALIVGGTGPTGPHIVSGLRQRGYEITILHRGNHELPELEEYEHIHVDPHFIETLQDGLTGRTFDLAIATYGRIRHVARALAGKVERFMSVSSNSLYRGYEYPTSENPSTLPIPTNERYPIVYSALEQKFSFLISSTERSVFEFHQNATIFRYSSIYGPRQLMPREWSVVRRIIDRRPHIVLMDGGLAINSAMYTENAAHAVLLAVDKLDLSAGKAYNLADTTQLTYRDIVEIVSRAMQYDIGVYSFPDIGDVRKIAFGGIRRHMYMDTYCIRSQLGYMDVVEPADAVSKTALWLAENPPERGSVQDKSVDLFDYDAEDRLIELCAPVYKQLEQIHASGGSRPMHAYAHPKKPGVVDQHGR